MNSLSRRPGRRATVRDLSDPYGNVMFNPLAPSTPEVCEVCLTFTDRTFGTCYRCGQCPRFTNAVLPISYSPNDGQLHTALAGYKRGWIEDVQRHFRRDLAAILWRFLRDHEHCIARRAGISDPTFDRITTVPSGSADRDRDHPFPRVVSGVVEGTGERFQRLLRRSSKAVEPRTVDREKYEARCPLSGSFLLVDDTWTTGASSQSAAGALLDAGAEAVGVVVIGRYMNDDLGSARRKRLDKLPTPFDWDRCAHCLP